MPFENIYKAEDEHHRKWWQGIGMSIILLTLYIGFSYSVIVWKERRESDSKSEMQNQWIEVAVNNCNSLPITPNILDIERQKPVVTYYNASVIYRFKTNNSLRNIFSNYSSWLKSNGWENYSDMFFRRGSSIISFEVNEEFNGFIIKCSTTR